VPQSWRSLLSAGASLSSHSWFCGVFACCLGVFGTIYRARAQNYIEGVARSLSFAARKRQMSERFELLDIEGDISGKLRLIYGSGPADPAPFVLTLTPQYVARASGKTPPVSFHEIERYADENAGDLREMAFREKATGRLNLTLE
jgi:hypothetical protein